MIETILSLGFRAVCHGGAGWAAIGVRDGAPRGCGMAMRGAVCSGTVSDMSKMGIVPLTALGGWRGDWVFSEGLEGDLFSVRGLAVFIPG